jgi:hypothetical protein
MATHEDVKEFNREINSVLATAPPISRAKMAAITKSALKAQSVRSCCIFMTLTHHVIHAHVLCFSGFISKGYFHLHLSVCAVDGVCVLDEL